MLEDLSRSTGRRPVGRDGETGEVKICGSTECTRRGRMIGIRRRRKEIVARRCECMYSVQLKNCPRYYGVLRTVLRPQRIEAHANRPRREGVQETTVWGSTTEYCTEYIRSTYSQEGRRRKRKHTGTGSGLSWLPFLSNNTLEYSVRSTETCFCIILALDFYTMQLGAWCCNRYDGVAFGLL